jgi:hypothetical protein
MNPYQLIDRPDAPLLGHAQPLKLILERLNELHVCVIAPRLFGKTRLLRQVTRMAPENGFSQCLTWDLKRHTPQTDEEFDQSLAHEMERQIQVADQDLPKWFREMGTGFESIKAIFQELNTAGQKVLIALDGIEGVLQAGLVTKNAWDNLRDLAELSAVRFVTASRLPLRQLCPPDSKTSPFWNIFHPTPVRFGAFQTADWTDVLQPFAARKVTFDESARKELSNWTGGIPVLTIAVCERLFEGSADGQAHSKADIDAAAESVLQENREHIEMLWADLPTESQLDEVDLANNREKHKAGLAQERVDLLLQRGLAVEAGGNKLRSACRIMERYAQQRGQSLPDVEKLFSATEDYERNIPEVLQLRLSSVRGFDSDAEHHVTELVKAMPNPETAKALIRNVLDACLSKIIDFEFEQGTINNEWVNRWKNAGKLAGSENDRDILAARVPRTRGARMRLLRLIHGHDTAGTARCRYSTLLLLETLFAAQNFGEHATERGEGVSRGFISVVALAAVECLEQLKDDIGS